MEVNQVHSKLLSKRFRQDLNFASLLFSADKQLIEVDTGIKQAKYLKDFESFLSGMSVVDSDDNFNEQLKNITDPAERKELINFIKHYQRARNNVVKRRLNKSKHFNKKLKLFPVTIKRNPSIKKSMRFYEHSYPLDSSIFKNQSCDVYHCLNNFLGLSDFNSIFSVDYCEDNKTYKCNIIERVQPQNKEFYDEQERNYYIEWLRSLGDKRALDFIGVLEAITESKKEQEKQNLTLNQELPNSKIMLKELTKEELDYIYTKPHSIKTTILQSSETGVATSGFVQEYSMSLLMLQGYTEEQRDEVLCKLLHNLVYNSILFEDFIHATTNLLLKNKHPNLKKDITDPINDKMFILKDRFDQHAYRFNMQLFGERWFENGNQISKSYTCISDLECTL